MFFDITFHWLISLLFTAFDDIRLVGGISHCSGTLEMRHQGEWRPAVYSNDYRDLEASIVVCRQLGCGTVISMDRRSSDLPHSASEPLWEIRNSCDGTESSLLECGKLQSNRFTSRSRVEVICSGKTKYFCLSLSSSLCVYM